MSNLHTIRGKLKTLNTFLAAPKKRNGITLKRKHNRTISALKQHTMWHEVIHNHDFFLFCMHEMLKLRPSAGSRNLKNFWQSGEKRLIEDEIKSKLPEKKL